MLTVYACTLVEKEVEVDSYENGADPDTRKCLLSQKENIKAQSLVELVRKIGEAYGLEMDDLFLPQEPVTYVGFNRLENNEGFEPTPAEMAKFKKGLINLWLADYTFGIEKRHLESIERGDFYNAGIKFH